MAFLIYMTIKITVKFFLWALLIELWLCWAIVAMPVALIASLTGNNHVARQWQRSMNWRRAFRI